MKRYNKHFSLLLLGMCHMYTSNCQELSVKDSVPDIIFKQMINFKTDEARLSDFEKKLVILDFWATWCGPCISSIEELHDLQKQFKNEIQVILLGKQDKETIRKFVTKKGWTLPVAMADTALLEMFPHKGIPHQVWLKDGKVQAIPVHYYTNQTNINAFLRQNSVSFYTKKDQVIERNKPLLSTPDGMQSLYYSAITSRINSESGGWLKQDSVLLAYNQSLVDLLVMAYRIPRLPLHSRVIYEVDDSLQYMLAGPGYPSLNDSNAELNAYFKWRRHNTYCYSQMIKKSSVTTDTSYEIMRDDILRFLNLSFGINATLQERNMKVYILSWDRKSKGLYSKLSKVKKSDDCFILKEQKIKRLVSRLSNTYYRTQGMKVIDRTGIIENISLKIEGDLKDLENVRQQLKMYGLTLKEGCHKSKMLVFHYQ